MKDTFLLDETVLERACSLSRADNTFDLNSARLVLAIYANGHRLALSEDIRLIYYSKLKKLEEKNNPAPFLDVAKIVSIILIDEDRISEVNTDSVKVNEDVPDRAFVEAAIARRPIFVTHDVKLVEKLKVGGLIDKYGLRVMSVDEALLCAESKDC